MHRCWIPGEMKVAQYGDKFIVLHFFPQVAMHAGLPVLVSRWADVRILL